MTFTTRFAPSPTGPLHLGHAYSALLAHDMAQAAGGTFHLRIDDLDQTRARSEWEAQIYDDLAWLCLDWSRPCRRESECAAEYERALDRLWQLGLLYPCTCTRRDIREALSAPQEGTAAEGPGGLIYPGTCRAKRTPQERPKDLTLRLDMARALQVSTLFDQPQSGFAETGPRAADGGQYISINPEIMIARAGDVVLAHKNAGAAYHLAVVVDDAAQQITHVIRGEDLFNATKIHVLLQNLLGYSTPIYHHHRLIRDDKGKRLAKRDDARAIAKYRAEGATPQDIRAIVSLG